MSYGKRIYCLHCGYEEDIKFTGDQTCGIYFLYLDEKTGKYRNIIKEPFSLVGKEMDKYYGRQMIEIGYERLESYLERFRCPKCKEIGFELEGLMWVD